jgi:hypothetical protein
MSDALGVYLNDGGKLPIPVPSDRGGPTSAERIAVGERGVAPSGRCPPRQQPRIGFIRANPRRS